MQFWVKSEAARGVGIDGLLSATDEQSHLMQAAELRYKPATVVCNDVIVVCTAPNSNVVENIGGFRSLESMLWAYKLISL